MNSLILSLTTKDWLIFITLCILALCILRIRKQKKIIVEEVKKKTIPQLSLELLLDEQYQKMGFYLCNESYFLVKSIRLKDVQLTLEDFGVNQHFILRFENIIDFLRPNEKVKLDFKVLDREYKFLPAVTEKIVPHLIDTYFKVSILYSDIEDAKFLAVLSKKDRKFLTEKITPYQ